MTLAAVCALCESAMAPGDGAAAFRGRMAHLTCWLEWRGGRRPAPRPRRPDLVLLDLHLLDLDGFEVCRRIKTNPETAWMRVLPVTTVFRDEADRRRAFDVGADGYLIKPIAAAELIATVNGLLGARNPLPQSADGEKFSH